MTPWLIVAGDLTPLGGMDVANHALARHLADGGAEVHLVTHRAWDDLVTMPSVMLHQVSRPLRSHLLGSPFLARAGRREWRQLRPRRPHAVVNGGNCRLPGANWVHYLHAAYAPETLHLAVRKPHWRDGSISRGNARRSRKRASLSATAAARATTWPSGSACPRVASK